LKIESQTTLNLLTLVFHQSLLKSKKLLIV
jgi:hypothetical protein